MPQWFFEMVDNLSAPAKSADRALDKLQDELRGTEKAIADVNKVMKETKLQKAMGLDMTRDQREHTKAVLQNAAAQKLRLSIQRDSARQAMKGAPDDKDSLGDAMAASRALFRSRASAQKDAAAESRRVEKLALADAMRASRQMSKDKLRAQREVATARKRDEAEALADAMRASREAARYRVKQEREAAREIKRARDRAEAMAGNVMSGLRGLATGAMAGAVGMGALGLAFAASTAQAAEYGEAQRRILQGQFGAVEGARQYEVLLEYSNRFGTSIQDTMEQFQTLSRAGFNQPQVIGMMQQIGDVASTMGHEAAGGITLAIRQIMDAPRQSKEELNQLAERGVNIQKVFTHLGEALGVTAAQANEMFKNGQISKGQEINAIMQTMNDDFSQGGIAGTGMGNRLQTIGGKIDLIRNRWTLFQTRVGETNAFAPVNTFLGSVADMLDNNTTKGQEFQRTLNDLFTGLFGKAGNQDPVKMFKDIAGGIQDAVHLAKDLVEIFGGLAKAIAFAAHGFKLVSDVAHGRAVSSSDLNGISMGAELRGVRGSGPSNQQVQMARAMGEENILPTSLRTPHATAARTVTTGDIVVNISGVDSAGMTPAEAGQAAAQAVDSHVNRALTSANASQGNPT